MDTETEDIDSRLSDLFEQSGELLDKCLFRSALGIYGEIHRTARRENRLGPYLRAIFHQMDLNKDMLEPKASVEKAVELIGLLESPERAALIQNNYEQAEYEQTVSWMSACAYENLADATGMMEGFNSEGMHACIADGLEVCRRTGKLGCINCFREYASDVYTAGEDLYMALHHSRTIMNHKGSWSGRGDRRWVGARSSAWMLTLQGQLDAAEAALKSADETCQVEGVSIPLQSRIRVDVETTQLRLLLGTAPLDAPFVCPLPPGENPFMDLRWALCEALRLVCTNQYDAARAILVDWDRRLSQKQCLHDWFEVRLRLIALQILAGKKDSVDPMIEPLVEKAKKAHDWLTLHRLSFLMEAGPAATPLALLDAARLGPFATAAATPPPEAATQAASEPPAAPPPTPLEDVIQELYGRLETDSETGPDWDAIIVDVLAIEPGRITEPADGGRLIHLLLISAGETPRGPAMWDWTQAVVASFPQNAALLNIQCDLGDYLRNIPESPLAESITTDDLEKMFRQSLDLDPFNPHNHARAGGFFLRQGNVGEAERSFARGFRLMRGNAFVAQSLADIYDRTERPRDALAVLDLCLREGAGDARIAWQASLLAHRLEQYEAMLTYLDRFDQLAPDQPWTNYYRTIGCLETGKPDAALAALETEARVAPENPFPVLALRVAVFSKLGRDEESRQSLEAVLAMPLVSVETLTMSGIASLFERMWTTVTTWPSDDLKSRFIERMLAAGVTHDTYFETLREAGEAHDGLSHFRITLRQPLGPDWPTHPGCLFQQKEWKAFGAMWGILAASEDDAKAAIRAWHVRSFPADDVEIQACEALGENYSDKPGVVWQGQRWCEDPE